MGVTVDDVEVVVAAVVGQLPLFVFVTPDDLPGTALVGTILDFGIRKTCSKTSPVVNPSTIFCFIRLNGAFGCTEIPDIPLT